MKRFFAFLMCLATVAAQTTNTTIARFPEVTSPRTDDFMWLQYVGGGTTNSRKIAVTNLLNPVNLGLGTVSATELNHLDGATNNIQDQLNALAGGTGTGVTDGDKGDITVSGTGTVWTVDLDSVALGTDTTGDYVATIGGDTEIVVTGTGTEGRAVTLSIGSAIARDSEVSAAYQPIDADLTRIATVSGVSGDILFRDASGWTNLAKGVDGTVLKLSGGFPAWGVDNTAGSGASISDDAFSASWNGDATNGASRNTLYDVIASLQTGFSTGAGVTNVANVLSANLAAGSNITLATNSNGQVSIASTATGGGASTSNNIPSSVTYSGTNIFIDAGSATLFRITLTNSAFLHAPTNASDGQQIRLSITQDAVGSRLLSYTNSLAFGSDLTGLTLTTNANKTDWITMIYWSASNRWDVLGTMMGY